jgi:nucleoside-diphosphate-sugar epimerase
VVFGTGDRDLKHLITGGCGFLGTLITQRLLERGESVTVLDIWRDAQKDPQRSRGAAFVQADVCDRAAVADAMRGVAVVHHTAALVPLAKAGDLFRRVNVDGSRIVAEEAVRAGVQVFVHLSSSAIYGGHPPGPITSQTAPAPVEIYGRSKLEAENVVREVCYKAGLPLILVRPRTILGMGRLGIFKILFDWVRDGRAVYVIGDGNIRYQFVHAHDLMAAYMMAIDRGQAGVFNVGTDRFETLRAALEHLIAHSGTASRVRNLPERLTIGGLEFLDHVGLSPLAPWHYLTYHKEIYFDVEPLHRMGWQAKYSNDEMFRETYDWFIANHESLRKEGQGGANSSPVKEGILWLLKQLS